jgi:hypothetical protein
MPLLAFAAAFLAGRSVREYTSHKQQMNRIAEAQRNVIPGEYLTWLSK